jgi:hypothetical protein
VKKKPSLKSLKNKAWKLCSEYVRRKEADAGGYVHCYTCLAPIHWKLEAQAGHAIGGRNNAVLLDVEIIRPQCVACNVFRRGNYPIFAAKLIRENGIEWFEKKLAGARGAVKLTRSDYEGKIDYFKRLLAQLENELAETS